MATNYFVYINIYTDKNLNIFGGDAIPVLFCPVPLSHVLLVPGQAGGHCSLHLQLSPPWCSQSSVAVLSFKYLH